MFYTPCFIGEDCEAAYRWAQLSMPLSGGPFEKKGITTVRLIKFLEDRFQYMCLKQNLKISGPLIGYENSLGNCLRVSEYFDNKIGLEIWHDFLSHEPFDVMYKKFMIDFNIRLEKFKNMIIYDLRPILFIHKKTDIISLMDYEDIKNQYIRLISLLKYIRNGKKFLVAGLGHDEKFNDDWKIENLKTYQIHTPKLWGSEQPEKAWQQLAAMCGKHSRFII